jgi:phospholipid/cholesterol/gamma-HCH transport system ATP-binding protein
MVTHRYQDGNLIANFRYNSEQGGIEPVHHTEGHGERGTARTTFMVLKEGRLVFEGDQDSLESSKDAYVCKFVKQRE